MLLDVEFSSDSNNSTIQYCSHDEAGANVTKGKAEPKFFRAHLENGILRIPR